MKLLRIKITDPDGFRSLPCGFEYHLRTEWTLQNELNNPGGFSPFVCAGPNGSGKSNLLEVLAAIFFQLEVLRVQRNFLPEALKSEEQYLSPAAFELEYLIKQPVEVLRESERYAHVSVTKISGASPQVYWLNPDNFASLSEGLASDGLCGESQRDFLLPEYIVGYSSGENEILSLPFFKMRFVQFDEYWNSIKTQSLYRGRPDTRLTFLDNEYSQAILLCNLLMQDENTLRPFRENIGLEELREFRIIIKRSIEVTAEVASAFQTGGSFFRGNFSDSSFSSDNPVVVPDKESGRYIIRLTQQLESDSDSLDGFAPMITRLKRCATCWFIDDDSDNLIIDFLVNEATKKAFRENFDYATYKSPLGLFQAFQVLLTLNLYSVNEELKANLYQSNSHYVRETVSTLAADQRVMRFENVCFTKQGIEKPMLLKELSDGEHQLLHSLGLCLLFRNTNSLFLLDEPETHFNPDWRAKFISSLRECLPPSMNDNVDQEMLITTHTPFLISDSKPDKVLVFKKDKTTGAVSISRPDYNTLGASINKITMSTFGKRETIGGHAQTLLESLRKRFETGDENNDALIDEIHQQLGDSVEKVLLIKTILESTDGREAES